MERSTPCIRLRATRQWSWILRRVRPTEESIGLARAVGEASASSGRLQRRQPQQRPGHGGNPSRSSSPQPGTAGGKSTRLQASAGVETAQQRRGRAQPQLQPLHIADPHLDPQQPADGDDQLSVGQLLLQQLATSSHLPLLLDPSLGAPPMWLVQRSSSAEGSQGSSSWANRLQQGHPAGSSSPAAAARRSSGAASAAAAAAAAAPPWPAGIAVVVQHKEHAAAWQDIAKADLSMARSKQQRPHQPQAVPPAALLPAQLLPGGAMPHSAALPPLSTRVLTSAIMDAQTWQQLAGILQSYAQDLDHIHASALLVRAAKLSAAAADGAAADADGVQSGRNAPGVGSSAGLQGRDALGAAVTEADGHAAFLKQLLETVAGLLPQFGPRQLGNMLWALSVLDAPTSAPLFDAMADRLSLQLDSCSPQAMAAAMSGLARRGRPPSAAWLERLFAASGPKLRRFGPQELSTLMWALATLGCQPPGSWLRCFVPAVEAALLQAGGSSDTLPPPPQAIANTLWACAKLQVKLPRRCLAQVLQRSQAALGQFGPKALATTLWALGTMRAKVPQEWVRAALAAAVPLLQPQPQAGGMGPHALSSFIWGISALKATPDAAWLRAYLAALDARGSDFSLQAAASTAYALAGFASSTSAPIAASVSALLDAVAARLPSEGVAFSARDGDSLALLLWSCSRLGLAPSAPALAAACAALQPQLSSISHVSLVNLLGALGAWRHQPPREWVHACRAAVGALVQPGKEGTLATAVATTTPATAVTITPHQATAILTFLSSHGADLPPATVVCLLQRALGAAGSRDGRHIVELLSWAARSDAPAALAAAAPTAAAASREAAAALSYPDPAAWLAPAEGRIAAAVPSLSPAHMCGLLQALAALRFTPRAGLMAALLGSLRGGLAKLPLAQCTEVLMALAALRHTPDQPFMQALGQHTQQLLLQRPQEQEPLSALLHALGCIGVQPPPSWLVVAEAASQAAMAATSSAAASPVVAEARQRQAAGRAAAAAEAAAAAAECLRWVQAAEAFSAVGHTPEEDWWAAWLQGTARLVPRLPAQQLLLLAHTLAMHQQAPPPQWLAPFSAACCARQAAFSLPQGVHVLHCLLQLGATPPASFVSALLQEGGLPQAFLLQGMPLLELVELARALQPLADGGALPRAEQLYQAVGLQLALAQDGEVEAVLQGLAAAMPAPSDGAPWLQTRPAVAAAAAAGMLPGAAMAALLDAVAASGTRPDAALLNACLAFAATHAALVQLHDAVSALQCCALLRYKPPASLVQALLLAHQPALGTALPSELCGAAWALAAINQPVSAEWLTAWEGALAPGLGQLEAPELVQLAWSLAGLEQRPQGPLPRLLVDALGQHLHALEGGSLATVAHSVSLLGQAPPQAWMEALCLEAAHWLPTMSGASLVLLLRGLARLRHAPSDAWLDQYMAAAQQALSNGGGLSAGELASMLCALAGLGARPHRTWLTHAVQQAGALMGGFTAESFAEAAWALDALDRSSQRQHVHALLAAARARYGEAGLPLRNGSARVAIPSVATARTASWGGSSSATAASLPQAHSATAGTGGTANSAGLPGQERGAAAAAIRSWPL